MNNTRIRMKAIISGILANDEDRVAGLVNELTESIVPDKEDDIMDILTESFKGDTNV